MSSSSSWAETGLRTGSVCTAPSTKPGPLYQARHQIRQNPDEALITRNRIRQNPDEARVTRSRISQNLDEARKIKAHFDASKVWRLGLRVLRRKIATVSSGELFVIPHCPSRISKALEGTATYT